MVYTFKAVYLSGYVQTNTCYRVIDSIRIISRSTDGELSLRTG